MRPRWPQWVLLLTVFAAAWLLGRYVPRSYDPLYIPLLIVLVIILLAIALSMRRSGKSNGNGT